MILKVKVIPKASRVSIKEDSSFLKVHLTKPALDGLANQQLIDLLSDYLGVKRYRIKIVQGEKSRNKVIEVDEPSPS